MLARSRVLPGLAVIALTGFGLVAAEKNDRVTRTKAAVEERMRHDITFLASDQCEGRGVSTKGINLAADYIAAEFKKAGLKAADKCPDYFQSFSIITGNAKLEEPNSLKLRGPLGQAIELKMGDQFIPVGFSESGKVKADLVFVGYGATADALHYDDYKDIDVTGKIVVVLRKTPRSEVTQAGFEGGKEGPHASLQAKLVNAGLHKAAAVFFVNDHETAKSGDKLMDFAYTANSRQSLGIPAIHVHRSLVEEMLQSTLNATLRDVEKDIDETLKPASASLKGWSADLEINIKREKSNVKNIIGVLEGAGPLANETVVIGAHYDHLGYGGRGSGSLAKDAKEPQIHHGADDNGSGTTTIMELARRFGEIPHREGRRLVFMTFTGEESGLLGSMHYCNNPLYPLADTVAMVNLDMVGRLRPDMKSSKDKLYVYGTGTDKHFDKLLTDLNQKFDFQMQKTAGTRMVGGSSDHASFYAKKIPVLFLFTGNHPDYHRPSDTADKINVEGMAKVADLTEELIDHLARQPDRPEYVKIEGGSSGSPGMNGPRLGIMPSYGDEKEGVLLEAVSKGAPAEKAGMKEGDRIVEIGGKPVKNLEVYMVLMASQKKGDTVEIGFLRDGKKEAVKVKLE
ncbi:MAG: M28 family peptidase [Gemmataceae bacterium]